MALLHWIDYAVFGTFLVISLAIGLYTSKRQQYTTASFISGDKQMSVFPVMISSVVSYLSSILILGVTAETYAYGTFYWVTIFVIYTIGPVMAERFFVPLMYRQKLTSVYEYLEHRFSRRVRILCVVIGLLTMVLYTGVAIYGPSTALEAASGIPQLYCMLTMAGVCAIYTCMGGMKAVVYTDVFQAFVMLVGCSAVLVKALMLSGGIHQSFKTVEQDGRAIWMNLDVDPRARITIWNVLFSKTINISIMLGVSQPAVQRYCAVSTLSKARQVVLLSILVYCFVNLLIGLTALGVCTHYSLIQCDPVASGKINSPNQILPYFVADVFQSAHGVSGIFMAALFSGAMSSVSSSLSSIAAVIWKDIIQLCRPQTSERAGTIINKVVVLIAACLAVVVAVLAASQPSIPITQTVLICLGLTGGPIGGVFILGATMKRANEKGALAGVITAITIMLWIGLGSMTITNPRDRLPPLSTASCPVEHLHQSMMSPEHPYINQTVQNTVHHTISGVQHLYTLSFLWYALCGFVITLVVGITISCITNGSDQKVDKKLLLNMHDLLESPFKSEKQTLKEQESGVVLINVMKNADEENNRVSCTEQLETLIESDKTEIEQL